LPTRTTSARDCDPKRLCGIDLFTHTAVHESQHFAWFCEWWNNSQPYWVERRGYYGSQDDKDGDGLPNWVEDENLNEQWDNGEVFDWNGERTSTCPWSDKVVPNDEEWKNYRDHASVTGAPYYAKDWSFPGSNARVTVYAALR
jgi:hypothetical protein